MKTKVSTTGRITLPASLRALDGIKPGQRFVIERINRGEYRLIRQKPVPNEGLTALLLNCPAKGWFKPIKSESTNTVKNPVLR